MGYQFVAACKFPEDVPPSLPLRKTGKVRVMSSSLQRAAARGVSGRSSLQCFCSPGNFFLFSGSDSWDLSCVVKLNVKMLQCESGIVNHRLAGSPSSFSASRIFAPLSLHTKSHCSHLNHLSGLKYLESVMQPAAQLAKAGLRAISLFTPKTPFRRPPFPFLKFIAVHMSRCICSPPAIKAAPAGHGRRITEVKLLRKSEAHGWGYFIDLFIYLTKAVWPLIFGLFAFVWRHLLSFLCDFFT